MSRFGLCDSCSRIDFLSLVYDSDEWRRGPSGTHEPQVWEGENPMPFDKEVVDGDDNRDRLGDSQVALTDDAAHAEIASMGGGKRKSRLDGCLKAIGSFASLLIGCVVCPTKFSNVSVTATRHGDKVNHQLFVSTPRVGSPGFTVEYGSDDDPSIKNSRSLHSVVSVLSDLGLGYYDDDESSTSAPGRSRSIQSDFAVNYDADDGISVSAARRPQSMRSIQCSLGVAHQPPRLPDTCSSESSSVESFDCSSPPSYMVTPVGPDTIDLGYLDEIERRGNSCEFCKLIADSARIVETEAETDPLRSRNKRLKQPVFPIKCLLRKTHLCTLYLRDGIGVSTSRASSPRMVKISRLQLVLSPFLPVFHHFELQACFFPVPSIEDYCTQSSDGSELGRVKGSGRLLNRVSDPRLFIRWIQQCESLHGNRCANPAWLQDTHTPSNLKVIDVNGMCIIDALPDCRYLALSYVWGDAVSRGPVQTTRENIASRRIRGGLSDDFPQAIKDALELVRDLGERYLWVDAICINQDDDWEKAAFISQMDKIFAGALLTIIAAGSTAPYRLPGLRPGSREVSQPYVRVGDRLAMMRCVAHSEQHRLEGSEWNQRGWTFQERYTSRRCLVFTEKQVFWRCQMGIWNEENVLEPPWPPHWAMGASFACCDPSETDEVFTKHSMSALVTEYSTRKFTFPRDVLDGLAGILHGMQANTGELFHWGLPTSRFDQALAWYGYGKRIRDCRRIAYQDGFVAEVPFPSWAWVSYQRGDCHMHPANERLENRSRAGKSGSELKFYKVSDDGRVAPLAGLLVFHAASLPAGEDPFETMRKEWKGSCHIPEDSFTEASPFRDSGRLLFWTSYARLRLRRSDGAIISGDGMKVGTLEYISGSFSLTNVDLHDFIVISRAARIESSLENKKLNVMLVRWHQDEPGVCSRVGVGTVEEARWITGEREWRKVILA